MKISRILETCLYVNDLEKAARFYAEVLGLELFEQDAGRHVFFQLEDGMFLLFNPQATGESASSVPQHGARGPGHVAFRIPEKDLEVWRKKLRDHGVAIEQEITWPGGGYSIYFRDPSGNSLELATASLWKL